MKMATVKAVCLGEFTPGARQFLQHMNDNQMLDTSFEPNPDRFLQSANQNQAHVVFLEGNPESRNWIRKIRASNLRVLLVWFGRGFPKEDYDYALEHRVFAVLESPRPDDKKVAEVLTRLASLVERTQTFDQVLRSLKAVLLQSESEIPKAIISEIKTALGKMERQSMGSELMGSMAEVANKDSKVPFHKSQDFGDALSTVHDLERTGVLWVRGSLPGQEGKVQFLQGKIVAANAGEVHGQKAVFRMFLWDDPKFLFNRAEAETSQFNEPLNTSIKYICVTGAEYRARYDAIRREIPPGEIRLDLEPSSLRGGIRIEKEEFSTLASVVEFNSVSQVLNYNALPDVVLYESLIRLRRSKVVRVVA